MGEIYCLTLSLENILSVGEEGALRVYLSFIGKLGVEMYSVFKRVSFIFMVHLGDKIQVIWLQSRPLIQGVLLRLHFLLSVHGIHRPGEELSMPKSH